MCCEAVLLMFATARPAAAGVRGYALAGCVPWVTEVRGYAPGPASDRENRAGRPDFRTKTGLEISIPDTKPM